MVITEKHKELREEYTAEAMLGFLQSVRTYQSESGAFIPYAQTVIRNRLLNAAALYFSPAGYIYIIYEQAKTAVGF